MSHGDHDVNLIIKAHDHASGPLAGLAAKLRALKVLDPATHGHHEGHTLQGAFKEIGKAGKELGKEVFELGAKLGELLAIGGGVAFVELLHGSIEAGQHLEKMGKQLGMTADAYAQLAYAANKADVSQEEFDSAMQKFTKGVGEAKAGTGGLLEFLKRVSPVLAAQVRHAKSNTEAFDIMTKAIAKVEDPSRRAALSAAAFGKGSIQMGVFLGEGTEKIHEQMEAYEHLAGEQGEFAESAGEAEGALKDTRAAFAGLTHAAATELLPVLTDLAETAKEFFVEHRGELKEWAHETAGEIKAWVHGGGLQSLAHSLAEIAHAVGSVVHALGPMGTLVAATSGLWGPAALGVLELVKGFWALGKAAMAAKAAMTAASAAAAATKVAEAAATTGQLALDFGGGAAATTGGAGAAAAAGTGAAAMAALAAGALASVGLIAVGTYQQLEKNKDKKDWSLFEKLTGQEVTFTNPWSAQQNAAKYGLGPAASTGAAAPATAQKSAVTVDFRNVPKGVTIARDHGSDVDLSISSGPAMATP